MPTYAPAAIKPKSTPPIDLAFVSTHDGTKSTILLSENLDARDWIQLPPPPASPLLSAPLQPDSTGRSFWNAITWEQPRSSDVPNWGTEGVPPTGIILNKPAASSALTDYQNGRPYSNHSGGFFVTYCDGRVEFMSEQIEYRVYCLLMSPDSSNAKYTRNGALGSSVVYPPAWLVGTNLKPLTDSDIQ